MCLGCLMVGALLLAGCSLAAVGAFERGLIGWRRLAVVGYAGGLVVGVVAVFAAFGPAAGVARPAQVAAAPMAAVAVADGAAGPVAQCLDQRRDGPGVVRAAFRQGGRDRRRRHFGTI